MRRQMIRLGLAILLVLATIFAVWLWSADYSSGPDEEARMKVKAVQVTADESFYWVEIHLKRVGEEEHDLRKPVRLLVGDKGVHEPADTTFAGNPGEGFTEIWFKFWLSDDELESPMKLQINDGELSIKQNIGIPELGEDGRAVFRTDQWDKSWLGF